MDVRGIRQRLRTLVVMLAGGLLLATTAACGTTDETADDALLADAYVGEVDEDLFVGVLVAEDPEDESRSSLIVYLCDGADRSTWLFGEATDGTAVLEEEGARVELALGSVTGQVALDGAEPLAFTTDLAGEDAGLYRSVLTVDDQDYVGGWIVLGDGRQRGAITLGGRVIENPTLDVSSGEAATSIGTFGTNCFINPHTGERICRYMK